MLSEHLAALAALADTASEEAAALGVELATTHQALDQAGTDLAAAQARIVALEEELARRPPAPVPIPTPTFPDVLIEIDGVALPFLTVGESWRGRGLRWSWPIDGELRVDLDEYPESRGLILGRCQVGLDRKAPPRIVHVRVMQHGIETHNEDVRLCPGQRPYIPLKEGPPPVLDVAAAIRAGLLPNLKPVTISDALLADILLAKSTGKWAHGLVEGRLKMGWNVRSWTGGLPSENEPGPVPIGDWIWCNRQDYRLWEIVQMTARSGGWFPIHFTNAEGRYVRASETKGLPNFLESGPLTVTTASGARLPIPDAAHQHHQAVVAWAATQQRYFHELLQAWALFGVLSHPDGADRLNGVVFSGQLRETARTLSAWGHAHRNSAGDDREYYATLIRRTLGYMNTTFATPGGKEYRASGVLAVVSLDGETGNKMLQYRDPAATRQFKAWTHNVLASACHELLLAGFEEARPIRDHLLHLAELVRAAALKVGTVWDIPWGNLACEADGLDIDRAMQLTLALRTAAPTSYVSPITSDYRAWRRAADVVGDEVGLPWAAASLEFADAHGAVPLNWQLLPRTG